MRRLLKWVGRTIAALVLVVGGVGTTAWLVGRHEHALTYRVELPIVAVASGSDAVERGRHLVDILGCRQCHGTGLAGRVFLDIPPGRIVAPNLTRGRGGVGSSYAGGAWDSAVRFGLRPDGSWLLPQMPSALYHELDDADAAAVAAFLDQLPAVDNDLPATTVRPIGYIWIAFSDIEDQPLQLAAAARTVRADTRGPTPEHGAYLARAVCAQCHGAELRGGQHPAPGSPPGPDLRHAAFWPAETFAAVVRSGRLGERVLNRWMPSSGQLEFLTDEELAALHAYLRSQGPAAAEPEDDRIAAGSGRRREVRG